MTGAQLLVLVTAALILAGALELFRHKQNLGKIPIRVHVNGTRGKSSVTRLIAAGLREAGIRTCAKTTGTLARFILPDGRELPIFRPSGANVIEQTRIVATAAAQDTKVLVIECMALAPELQALSELKMIRATHGVITNARPDHLDVMGPGDVDVARALAGMVPVGGKLYTAEQQHAEQLRHAATDRGTEMISVGPEDVARISPEDLAPFSYTEHPDNVALALRLLEDLDVPRDVALRGMWKAQPDPGALTEYSLDFFGRHVIFVNGFAANDPVSTKQLWTAALERHSHVQQHIAVFNCRADRPDRSMQLGREYSQWQQADHIVLMGTGTYLFARSAIKQGVDSTRLVFAEDLDVEDLFERIIELVDESAMVMGMGNIGGDGMPLARHFRNRAQPKQQTLDNRLGMNAEGAEP